MAASRGVWCFLVSCVIVVLLGVTVTLLLVLRPQRTGCYGGFLHGAVAADSAVCSSIGRDILKQGGSPVDGAIAALLCTSVMHPQSMGLGGGVIFTIYNASTGKVEVINARERVPSRIIPDFMEHCTRGGSMKLGVQWIGVPGELRGYEAAHQRHGRLPWKTLFEPTIKLVKEGLKVQPVLSKYLEYNLIKKLLQNSSVCQLFCKDGEVLKYGDAVNFTQLGQTLSTVADEGADAFYQGIIAEKMLKDLQAQGSSLTLDDFKNYKVEIVKALNLSLGDYTFYTAPPPAGGALLSFILNVLAGYHFSANSMEDDNARIETYHKIAEAFKFANGQKARLVESLKTRNINEFTASLLSQSFAQNIRGRIRSFGNNSLSYYDVSVPHLDTYGTSHLSVISSDGSSVSVTSSINLIFGSMVYSPSTGIIFNNQLADFCSIYPKNQTPNEGEHPPSFMSPSILLSHNTKSQLVIGGSGGSMITSATALAIMNKLWFGLNLTEAITTPILHVVNGTKLTFEPSFNKAVQRGLQERGHQLEVNPFFMNVVQGVSQEGVCLFAHSDHRKMGKATGY
ncbi:glutathione hydrolase 5 proenzyme [Spea bombifrons]|uniref:glutathione hydrolase 5 proenzyme n=1 Tax=Spea bombifrons TaxID=233779 RepID=UPI00234A0BA9|nr:glutathione hydrolase 5 proenzyme [Spea bombifrons]